MQLKQFVNQNRLKKVELHTYIMKKKLSPERDSFLVCLKCILGKQFLKTFLVILQ